MNFFALLYIYCRCVLLSLSYIFQFFFKKKKLIQYKGKANNMIKSKKTNILFMNIHNPLD